MADLDVVPDSQRRSSSPLQSPTDDDPPDFRFLAQISQTAHPTLPRRGEKDFESHGTSSQASTHHSSRTAIHDALSVLRIHNPKSQLLGYHNYSTGDTFINHPRGPNLKTVGRGVAGDRLKLLPEEAIYLVERGSLYLRLGGEGAEGAGLSLQAAYAYLMGLEGLTLERWMVFAGLKRCGYVVQRAPTWYEEDYDKGHIPPRQVERDKALGFWERFYKVLFEGKEEERERLPQGPLVTPGLFRSYADIYRLLAIIPAHDAAMPTARESQRSIAGMGHPTSPTHPRIRCCWYVWKPSSDFRKSAPPPPDFRIAVINAREQGFPTMEQFDDLLQSMPYNSPAAGSDGQVYKRLKHGYRNVLLGVVDQGVISYMRIADAGFNKEKIYDRNGRGRGGKRGGMRGGRGRGRGRGR